MKWGPDPLLYTKLLLSSTSLSVHGCDRMKMFDAIIDFQLPIIMKYYIIIRRIASNFFYSYGIGK